MSEQLAIITERTRIIGDARAPVRAGADRRRRRARVAPLPGILRGEHPQPAHAARAYSRAVSEFMTWCEDNGVTSITAALHVSAWIEQQTRAHAAPTVKLRLAALRHLFDWLVTGQVMPTNPAGSVRGPSHVVKSGKTPVLSPEEARALIDSIDITTLSGLRDRALIG
jgi:site-specific recombinase XerD